MSGFIKHKRIWRIAAVILLVIAMLGPWAYDLIHVPAQYTCDGPNVRLQGDFCGLPISMLWAGPAAILSTITALLSGSITPASWIPMVPVTLMMLFCFAPLATIVVLLLRNEPGRWQTINAAALGLSGIAAAVYMSLQLPRPYGPPWGVLLYVVVALAALVLELLLLTRSLFRTPLA